MQKLGQHFLNNDSVLKKIIGAIEFEKGSTIIEIGPGGGALTTPLAAACTIAQCRIVAIEKDAALAAELVDKKIKGVEVVSGDALKFLPKFTAAAAGESVDDKNYNIVGNIPYYITGKLLRIISETTKKPQQCILMLQREVAERICAVPPVMNRLAASVQFWADTKIIAAVPKEDFIPPPKVDSAVVVLTKKPGAPTVDADRYYQTVRAVFAQPGKTILNNIFGAKKDLPKREVEVFLKKIGIAPDGRPHDLSIGKIAAIAGALWG
jgi:16S rRNA (adenine1518-N6/adenine1519-N6)-dimethyltransferase